MRKLLPILMLCSTPLWGQATTTIRALTDATVVYADDELACDQTASDPGGQPKSCTPLQLRTYILGDDVIVEADLKAVDAAADEDFLTYEATVGDFEWHSVADIANAVAAAISEGSLANDIILEADLKAIDAPGDEECLTYEVTGGDFEWQACGAGSGDVTDVFDCTTGDCNSLTIGTGEKLDGGTATADATGEGIILTRAADCSAATDEGHVCWDSDDDLLYVGDGTSAVLSGGGTSPKETYWTAAALLPIASSAADAVAPIASDTGTNNDMQVASFDDTTDECRAGTFLVPSDVGTGATTVTFRARYYAATGATNSAYWDFKHNSRAAGEVWDAAFTTEADGGCAPGSATQDTIAVCTWTETMTNLGWAASDEVNFELCRDANHASDNLVGDAQLIDFAVEMPRVGSTSPADAYYQFPAGAFEMHGTNQAPLTAVDGTNQDYLVRAFDDTTDECVWFRFVLPGDFDSTGTPVARAVWRAAAITGTVEFAITHRAVANGENIDQAGTTDNADAQTVAGTTLYQNDMTWNLTDTNWAANDTVYGKLCRDVSEDSMTGDAQLIALSISVPRS